MRYKEIDKEMKSEGRAGERRRKSDKNYYSGAYSSSSSQLWILCAGVCSNTKETEKDKVIEKE
jgi:hypothetical protein